MKKETDYKKSKGGFILHLLSGFAGLVVAIVFIILIDRMGFSLIYAIMAIIGIFVLGANLRQIYLLLKRE